MPTYEYVCDSCGSTFDIFQKMSEKPLKICSKCNEPSLRRVFSGGIAINFKGEGFYANDSKMKEGNKKSSVAPSAPAHASACSCSACSASSCTSCHK